MARAAVLGGLTWRLATASSTRHETPTARTILLDVPGWTGHLPGQHVDVRLTAPDGYTATRAYSIANASEPDRVEITVAREPGGEVSSYLAGDLDVGDQVEVRGPLGGWFVWRPDQAGPVQLIGGGIGLVPLVSMVRTRALLGSAVPMRLLCSVRDPLSTPYRDELVAEGARPGGVRVTWRYTRGGERPGERVGRLDAELVRAATIDPAERPTCYVCGPTGFVEAVTAHLRDRGHRAEDIRAERFGPAGGSP